MECEESRKLMMGYIDGELSSAERKSFERHLNSCEPCRNELKKFYKLKEVTDTMKFRSPEDAIWGQYWQGVYNRIERGVGWVALSISAIILIAYGLFRLVEGVIEDPTMSMVVKIAILLLIIGVAILMVSIGRERFYLWKSERYKDVRR
ncbi:MAG: zf-HC2 domain-containing protein [Fidelibacterota bacterium]